MKRIPQSDHNDQKRLSREISSKIDAVNFVTFVHSCLVEKIPRENKSPHKVLINAHLAMSMENFPEG